MKTKEIILHELIVAGQQMLVTMVGEEYVQDDFTELPEGYFDTCWDWAGWVTTSGDIRIVVACGVSQSDLLKLCSAMMGFEIDDKEILRGCLQEVLNMVLGATMGVVAADAKVKMGIPAVAENSALPSDLFAQESWLIRLSGKQLCLEYAVSI